MKNQGIFNFLMSGNPVHCFDGVKSKIELTVVNNKGLVFLVLVVVLAFLGVQHGLLPGLWCFLALRYCGRTPEHLSITGSAVISKGWCVCHSACMCL